MLSVVIKEFSRFQNYSFSGIELAPAWWQDINTEQKDVTRPLNDGLSDDEDFLDDMVVTDEILREGSTFAEEMIEELSDIWNELRDEIFNNFNSENPDPSSTEEQIRKTE